MAAEYALMFRSDDEAGRRLFVLAMEDPEDDEGLCLASSRERKEVMAIALDRYEEMKGHGVGGIESVMRHAKGFGPAVVGFPDTEAFLRDVVGYAGEEVLFVEVSCEAGTLNGVECLGPDAAEAYAAGMPVPLYRDHREG